MPSSYENSREVGSMRNESISLGNLGEAYVNPGNYERAINYSEQALKIAREINYRQGEAIQINKLGLAYVRTGLISRGEEFHQSLQILEGIESPYAKEGRERIERLRSQSLAGNDEALKPDNQSGLDSATQP
jgi:tetratricopeptide (TPR) repeat protein